MNPSECLAQLGAAMFALRQAGEHVDTVKIVAFLWGFGIALALGIMFTSLFYEWHFQAGIAFQRQLDHGLLPPESTAAKLVGWRWQVWAWAIPVLQSIEHCIVTFSHRIEEFATKERRLPKL